MRTTQHYAMEELSSLLVFGNETSQLMKENACFRHH